jgi:hypothetical protein
VTETTTVTRRQPAIVTVALGHQETERSPHSATTDLTGRLCALFDDGVSVVVVDLSRLRSMSSEVVGALLSVRREAGVRGGHVVLRASTHHSMAMLRRSRLAGLFEISTADGPAWRHG